MDITVKELKKRLDDGESIELIDVRESWEWDEQYLPGSRLISLGSIPSKISELSDLKEKEVVVICRAGGRSGQAVAFMKSQGFSGVRNLQGGLLAWKQQIDPSFEIE